MKKTMHKTHNALLPPGKIEVAAMEKAKSVRILDTGKSAASKKRGRYK